MKVSAVFFVLLLSVLVAPAFATECPGFCVECRSTAVALCGAGCIQSYSCSLQSCTCSFTCRTSGGCPHSPTALQWRDSLTPKLEFASWQESATYSPPSIRFDVISQPELPLRIDKVSVRNDPGRQASVLTYTVTNTSGTAVRAISLLVTFFNDRNEPLGGEVVRGGQNCAREGALDASDGKELKVSLSHYVDSGQRVSLAVSSFRTDTQSWNGDQESIVKSMKQLH